MIALYVRRQGARASQRYELHDRYEMGDVDLALNQAARRKEAAVLLLADGPPLEIAPDACSILTWGPADQLDALARRKGF